MRFCHKCGANVTDNAIFCEQCGIKLGSPAENAPNSTDNNDDPNNIEEIDLTELDKKTNDAQNKPTNSNQNDNSSHDPEKTKKQNNEDNIINIQDILESDDKVEMDSSIKRKALADEEDFSKICPMCGEDLQINKSLLENTPVLIKCLKCGNETKIW